MGNVISNQGQVNNIALYKKCQKKSHEVYVCMPKLGTKFIDKWTGKEIITTKGLGFIISGVIGELYLINATELALKYSFSDNMVINESTLTAKLQKVDNESIIDWVKVKSKGINELQEWAVQASSTIVIVHSGRDLTATNQKNMPHGRGDFIVCSDSNGRPNLSDKRVVNGIVFTKTYDNRGWVDNVYTEDYVELPKPRSLTINSTKVTKPTNVRLNIILRQRADLVNIVRNLRNISDTLRVTNIKFAEENISSKVLNKATNFSDISHFTRLDFDFFTGTVRGYAFIESQNLNSDSITLTVFSNTDQDTPVIDGKVINCLLSRTDSLSNTIKNNLCKLR